MTAAQVKITTVAEFTLRTMPENLGVRADGRFSSSHRLSER